MRHRHTFEITPARVRANLADPVMNELDDIDEQTAERLVALDDATIQAVIDREIGPQEREEMTVLTDEEQPEEPAEFYEILFQVVERVIEQHA